jgi:sugar phosphate isomerase/epimerase
MRKAICNKTFPGWKIEEVLHYAGEIGYDGVEIDPYTLAPSVDRIGNDQRRGIRRIARKAGLQVVGIHSVTKSPESQICINHPEESVRTSTVEHLVDLITFCSDIGGKILVFGGAKERSVHPDLTPDQSWNLAADSFRQILDVAKKEDVVVCLEPLSHRLTDFVTTAAEAMRMVEEIDHPNFRMMLDVRSATDDERPIPELISMSAKYLSHFHANDDNGRGPGYGGADYAGISGALREIGYGGYLSVEVFDVQKDLRTVARKSLAFLRHHFD